MNQTQTPVTDRHLPVLREEVVTLLQPLRGGVFLDATLGIGGHTEAILQVSPEVRCLCIDQDAQALAFAAERLAAYANRVTLVQGNFTDIKMICARHAIAHLDGILADLGVSSLQLDEAERGFSFRFDAALDMRMNTDTNQVTAATIINTWLPDQLVRLFRQYGEERFAQRIVESIVKKRRKAQISSTYELAQICIDAYPPVLRHKRPHPATRVFQALRIEVNREIEALEHFLQVAPTLLTPNGRLVVITFHSLEDRPVKHAFRSYVSQGEYSLLTKKAITPSEAEQKINPRARSAKVRGLIRSSNYHSSQSS